MIPLKLNTTKKELLKKKVTLLRLSKTERTRSSTTRQQALLQLTLNLRKKSRDLRPNSLRNRLNLMKLMPLQSLTRIKCTSSENMSVFTNNRSVLLTIKLQMLSTNSI